jgi:hypothetical protein
LSFNSHQVKIGKNKRIGEYFCSWRILFQIVSSMKLVQRIQEDKYVPHDEIFCNKTDEKDTDFCISSSYNLRGIGLLSYRGAADQHHACCNGNTNPDFYTSAHTHTHADPGTGRRMIQLLGDQ